jgi:PAS domain S-box-containing protein
MADGVDGNLQFGPFELSSRERVLRREGVALPLGGRALDLLIYLADRPGEVIAKQELIDHVWSDVTVEEGSLRVHVAAIRKALGDGQFGNRYIANIKGRGYSFVGTVVPLTGNTESRNDKFRQQGRLPVRPLMMIGRETAVGKVSDKLRDERFVTLLGPGGIGKTTIALAVGRAVAEEFGGNVYFVDLESLTDSRHVTGAVSSAMEVTLSRKRAKSRTRGRKLHLTEAKARVGQARKTRADLEQELKACRREIAHTRERLAEATMQQIATSEMLRLISNAPIQSVLDAVAEHAARLCDAGNARIWRLEDNLLRLVASYGESSATMDGREGLPADRDTVTGRAACDRRTIHVHDIAAEGSEYPVGSRLVKDEGWRTTLATPLLREGTPIGIILVRRMEVRPFYDQQIALLETFADQAAIAIEKVRLLEAEKQRALALAHANRDLAEREAKIRRLVDSNIIGIFISDLKGRVLEANDAFLYLVGHDRDDLVSGRMRWTDLTPPEWRERDNRALAELSSNTIAQPYEKEFFRKDGSRVPVLIGGALFEEGGNEGVAFVVDLTERKRAEEALREREAKIRRLVDSNIIGIFVWDFEGRILEANDEFLRMVSYDREDLVSGRIRWADLTPPDWRDRNNARIERQKSSGRFEPFEKEYTRKDGSRVPVLIGGATFEEGGNQGVAFVLDLTERKRAEDALCEREAQLAEARRELRQMIDTIPIPVASYSADARRDFVNAAWKQYTGLSDEAALGTKWSVVAHPDDIAGGDKMWRDAFATGEPWHTEERVRRADGQYHWFAIDRVAARNENGKIIKWYGTAYDIEDRKRAEDALRESEAKFRDYAETASDWFWEIGPDYKFTLLTENAFGSNPADRIGTGCWDHALDLETETEKWRIFRATLDAHESFRDFVYCTVDGSGSPMYVRVSGKPVFDTNGEFRGYRGTGTDVTALMRAQEALRESERSARSAIDGIAGLVAIMAPNAELETVNRQLFEYFGQSLEWLKNWGTNDAVHPEDLPRVLELFERAMASGIAFNFELRLRRFDGEYRWFDNRGTPIRDDSGRIVRWYVLLTDIEDRTRALARLDQMQSDFAHMNRVSMMGELVASLSHEVKQPIATARNNARAALNFLGKQPPDLGEVREALGCIVGDADRAGDIIDRVRNHIRKAPPQNDRFDINAAINEVIVLAQTAIAENGVSIQIRLADKLHPVQGDRVQVQQVILNLVLNAVEAMGSIDAGARELVISTEQSQTNDALVIVRDSGPGIDPESLERVFEAFYTTKSSGMGMGLSICRSIIDAHGGRLWAEANEPGGTIFQFTIPSAEKELMNRPQSTRETGEPHQDTLVEASHRPASEGSKRPHPSKRGPEPDHRRRPSRGSSESHTLKR